MTILDLQRRLAEVGRIRLGTTRTSQRGTTYPAKLSSFRLTAPDQRKVKAAAELYGGEPRPWDAGDGRQQHEVLTDARDLAVIVPPTDMAFSQHYELWQGGWCQRRCDGAHEQLSDGACVCDPDARDCAITTRLNVMLRDVPGLGVWRLETHGYNAAVELGTSVQTIMAAAGQGALLPARLRLEERQRRTFDSSGQPTTLKFAVPVLDVDVAPGELLAGQHGAVQLEPGRAGEQLAQLDAGGDYPDATGGGGEPAPLQPVPASTPQQPAPSLAEQAGEVGQQPPAQRRNSAEPIPATGAEPRTASEAASAAAGTGEAAGAAITDEQHRKLRALYSELGIEEAEAKAFLRSRGLGSHTELTAERAGSMIDWLAKGGESADKLRALALQQLEAEAAEQAAAEQPPAGHPPECPQCGGATEDETGGPCSLCSAGTPAAPEAEAADTPGTDTGVCEVDGCGEQGTRTTDAGGAELLLCATHQHDSGPFADGSGSVQRPASEPAQRPVCPSCSQQSDQAAGELCSRCAAADDPQAVDWAGMFRELGIHGRTATTIGRRCAEELGIRPPRIMADLYAMDDPDGAWQARFTQRLYEYAEQDDGEGVGDAGTA